MRLDRKFVGAVLLLFAATHAAAETAGAAALEMQAPSLRAPDTLNDASGSFVLALELDPLAGGTLVSEDFILVLGAGAPPAPAIDTLFSDSFESN